MTNTETLEAAIAQTLAPALFRLCGKDPKEMGFPIYDTPEEVEDHLAQQFDTVAYWTEKATDLAKGLVAAIQAGGVDVGCFDYDTAAPALRAMRSDLAAHA